ncbi:endo-1,4-beta-xylanase [Flaviramulus sp. BrNp1-15]|uniref:endo-1,4-beta-xylanase n=1 Tax=Flaviramulus sp. BrNp1-15 TaxID=2916754 RepID=UPI001EE8FAF3|nr:endo-1,4-beta-xylanase [Flaviramulus sp. BrNp1-15]ULC60705.1 endo-1,4-beta-xylanase [Flaviramulus sp. BrNp1-15]
MKTRKILSILIIALLFIGCSSDSPTSGGVTVGGPTGDSDGGGDDGGDDGDSGDDGGDSTTQYLLDFADYPIGNIVSASKLASSSTDNTTFKEILTNEYNSITAENDMKPNNMFLGPNPDDYDWSDGDDIVAYAKANGFRVHGHVLAWHSQQPGWFNSFSGTDEEFETAVMDYITATVAHFAEEKDSNGNSIVASWDVYNEAFETDAQTNVLMTKIDDVIAKCFLAARAGDPDVKLFYNDFNVAGDVDKRNNILAMVADFQTRNIPIDGIGMQMHLNHNWPTDDLPLAIEQIADTGLLVHASELDVKANYGNDVTTLTAARAQEQADQFQRASYYYTTIVPSAQQYGITIWGFRDSDSWLYDNGGDWPLLYDNNFNTKTAYDSFIEGLKGNPVN